MIQYKYIYIYYDTRTYIQWQYKHIHNMWCPVYLLLSECCLNAVWFWYSPQHPRHAWETLLRRIFAPATCSAQHRIVSGSCVMMDHVGPRLGQGRCLQTLLQPMSACQFKRGHGQHSQVANATISRPNNIVHFSLSNHPMWFRTPYEYGSIFLVQWRIAQGMGKRYSSSNMT